MREYSPFLETIYDEPAPVGSLGRGTHYSVLQNENDRFAVIWDEDHDTRVIHVIEKMLCQFINNEPMISSVLFVGERKGTLTVILDKHHPFDVTQYFFELNKISSVPGDDWPADVGVWPDWDCSVNDRTTLGVIHDHPGHINTYLTNIYNLWSLNVEHESPADRLLNKSLAAREVELSRLRVELSMLNPDD